MSKIINKNNCIFDLAWIGQCKEPHLKGKKFCQKHLEEKCFKCKKQAVIQCDQDAGSFVCGVPYCEKHIHQHSY